MIGKIGSGKSASHLLRYCLEDKRILSEEDKHRLSEQDGLQHKNRAEVLDYNLCGGDSRELNIAFREVEQLSKRVEKPVFHITLRPSGSDQLSKEQWIEIGRECAREFGFEDHQFITVLHKDVNEPHIHIVANRVGFDGKAASDSNSYARMAKFCRKMELKYKLTQVLSPRAFLSPKDRLLPRQDARKEKLSNDLKNIFSNANNYAVFEKQVKALGYEVIKGRGIYFIDDKKVKIKGSEVGYSLATIEKILRQNERKLILKDYNNWKPAVPDSEKQGHKFQPDHSGGNSSHQKSLASELLTTLLEHTEEYNAVNPIEIAERKKKRKKGKRIS